MAVSRPRPPRPPFGTRVSGASPSNPFAIAKRRGRHSGHAPGTQRHPSLAHVAPGLDPGGVFGARWRRPVSLSRAAMGCFMGGQRCCGFLASKYRGFCSGVENRPLHNDRHPVVWCAFGLCDPHPALYRGCGLVPGVWSYSAARRTLFFCNCETTGNCVDRVGSFTIAKQTVHGAFQ